MAHYSFECGGDVGRSATKNDDDDDDDDETNAAHITHALRSQLQRKIIFHNKLAGWLATKLDNWITSWLRAE